MTETKSSTSQLKGADPNLNPERLGDKTKDVLILNPNRTIEIRTAEDAQQQFLRGFITEDEFRDVLSAHGISTVVMPPRGIERPDAAFARSIPDDLVDSPVDPEALETRLKRVREKAEQREKATKAADDVEAEAKPETDLATLQNEAAQEAADKVKVTPVTDDKK
jgi:hypothetical protein